MRYKQHSTPEARAASILGRIKSPAKAAAARENGKMGGRPASRYYAIHWHSGRGSVWSNTGDDAIHVYGFDSKTERDVACENFLAPDNCRSASLEPVPASDPRVRKAVRGTLGYGDVERASDVMAWNG